VREREEDTTWVPPGKERKGGRDKERERGRERQREREREIKGGGGGGGGRTIRVIAL